MSSTGALDIEALRQEAVTLGLEAASVDSFVDMDRKTLIIQGALWWSMARASQAASGKKCRAYDEAISTLLKLCEEKGVFVSDDVIDSISAIADL